MGGNTLKRKLYTNKEIEQLIDYYRSNCSIYQNPITGVKLGNHRAWKASISVKMEKESLRYFLFLITPPGYSVYSGKLLSYDDFSEKGHYAKFSREELDNRVWLKNRNYTISSETKLKISKSMKILYSTEKGREILTRKGESLKNFFKTEKGINQRKKSAELNSISMKNKILNNEFTPNITNRWTHWKAVIEIDGITHKFRSSWEACFWFCNQNLKYENFRIISDKRIYITDFFDEKLGVIYEIKPRSRYNIEIDKMNKIIEYCENNKYKFIWVNEHNIHTFLNDKLILDNQSATIQYNKLLKSCKKN
jgi:hypothetical protein